MSKVQAQTKSVRQLLSGIRYGIDFYQREYAWGRRHVEELLNDFEGRFLENFDASHERHEVGGYPHYFLGTTIIIEESGKRYIVDGQQRLTTLTLLLIYIQHKREGSNGIVDLAPMIFSESYGKKSFNIDIDDRRDCMDALYNGKGIASINRRDQSVDNLIERYEEIDELFPKSLEGDALPYFVDWLLESVDMVEIEAQTDDDAFTIFETMNGRGVSLSQADMLKGFLLANINSDNAEWMERSKTKANDLWRQWIRDLKQLEDEDGEVDNFFKTWLRAKYAETIRERKKGATNEDFENIDKYHRWTRANTERLRLNDTQDFYAFITQRMHRFADLYIFMRKASQSLTEGFEQIYYNAYNGFTLQYMLALAPNRLDDDLDTAFKKMWLVTIFADIFLVRKMVNFRRLGRDTLRHPMFALAKAIRDMEVSQLRDYLLSELENMDETFGGITGDAGSYESYGLNSFSGRRVRYLLARITAWVEQECGNTTTFDNYLRDAKGKPFEIEHIWADKYARHSQEFDSEASFRWWRNRFGGLVLLPRSVNRSLRDKTYKSKLEKYSQQNLLAASLSEKRYANDPGFRKFIESYGLQFRPHAQFNLEDLWERQLLYRDICEILWHPEWLNAI